MKIEATSALVTRWLGRMSFREALELQEEIVARKREQPQVPNELLLLEHEPVYTIGRTPDQSSLREAKHLPFPLFEINRGGQATYHGPGQLVGYFLLDLRRYGQDLHRYLRWIEVVLIELLAQCDLSATTRHGLTRIEVEEIVNHLSLFDHITPCGIAGVTMTSIEKETGVALSVEEVGKRMAAVAEERIEQLERF